MFFLKLKNGKRLQIEIIKNPNSFLKNVNSIGNGISKTYVELKRDYMIEILMMGLRKTKGINISYIDPIINKDNLKRFSNQGLIDFSNDNLKTTPLGRLKLNTIIESLII